jgi:transposase-like protein
MKSRRKFTSSFKAKVALEAIRERETLSALSSKYELTQEQISRWKHEFLEKSDLVFTLEQPDSKLEKENRKLKEIIGELHVQNDFLKKNLRNITH